MADDSVSNADTASSPKGARQFWLLSVYYFIIYMSGGSFANYISLYYAHLRLTSAEVGIITTVGAVVAIFMQPLWGVLADRARTKNMVICLAILGTALTIWLMPLSESTKIGLFIAFAVFTVFQCGPNPLSDAMTIEICNRQGYNFSTIRTMGSLGFAIVAFLSGQLLARDIRYIFPVYSVLMFVAFFIALPLPKVRGHQRDGDKKRFMDVLADKRLVILYTFALIIQSTHSFSTTFHAIYSADTGITTDVLGTGVMIGSLAQFPFMLLFPKIAKKIPVTRILCVSGLVHALRWFLYAYALNSVTVYFMWALHGLCYIVFYLCLADIVSSTVAPGLRASGQAMNALVLSGFSRVIGSMIGGFGAEVIGIRAMYIASGALCVAASCVFFAVAGRLDWDKNSGVQLS